MIKIPTSVKLYANHLSLRKLAAFAAIAAFVVLVMLFIEISENINSTRTSDTRNTQSFKTMIAKLLTNTTDQCKDNSSFNSINSKDKIDIPSNNIQYSNQQKEVAEPEYREIVRHPDDEVCEKRLPHAIIAGVQKCGTLALLYFLSDHPQIAAVLDPSEVKYFTYYKRQPLEWYRNKMNCSFSNQISIEKSPAYFYSNKVPAKIRNMNSKTKIILILKDPIVRTISRHLMVQHLSSKEFFNDTNAGEHFEKAVIDWEKGTVKKRLNMVKWSIYSHYITPWLANFPPEQILFVDGHNLENNPSEELRLVEDFLEIGTYLDNNRFDYNVTKGKPCLRSHTGEMKCLHDSKGKNHPELTETARTILQDYYRPFNERFFEMINRTFDWGY